MEPECGQACGRDGAGAGQIAGGNQQRQQPDAQSPAPICGSPLLASRGCSPPCLPPQDSAHSSLPLCRRACVKFLCSNWRCPRDAAASSSSRPARVLCYEIAFPGSLQEFSGSKSRCIHCSCTKVREWLGGSLGFRFQAFRRLFARRCPDVELFCHHLLYEYVSCLFSFLLWFQE